MHPAKYCSSIVPSHEESESTNMRKAFTFLRRTQYLSVVYLGGAFLPEYEHCIKLIFLHALRLQTIFFNFNNHQIMCLKSLKLVHQGGIPQFDEI
jgi:hypothetical protein